MRVTSPMYDVLFLGHLMTKTQRSSQKSHAGPGDTNWARVSLKVVLPLVRDPTMDPTGGGACLGDTDARPGGKC